MKHETFVVDASLLQELGERLIGRAPIALGELAKNSYDADAGTCQIEFKPDEIVISDNGNGMSESDFLQHWMRIGTTHKVDERVSPNGRQLTGSKGIGRLSVQFLANEMVLESTAVGGKGSLYVIVDWSTIVRGSDLQTVHVDWETRPDSPTYPDDHPTGTRITLRKLKTEWNEDSLKDLGREVWTFRSPFRRPPIRTPGTRSPDFDIEVIAPAIKEAQAALDTLRETLFDNWKARIRGTLSDGRRGGTANLIIEFAADFPEEGNEEKTYRQTVDVPIRPTTSKKPLVDGVRFEILIFKTEGHQGGGISVRDMREYLAKFGNVSVYDAGFRLPYYGSGRDSAGQDWLSIALDQGRRITQSELLPERLRAQNKYMLDLPAPGRIFGAVDINTNHERLIARARKARASTEWLQIQPGRDRLHDNEAFEQLRDLVRYSLDLYANRHRLRALDAIERDREGEPASKKFGRALQVLDENRQQIPRAVFNEVRREVKDASRSARVEEKAIDQRAALLAPLATAGILAVALNHELAREARSLGNIGSRLRRLSTKHKLPELAAVAVDFDDARKRLDALRSLFSPLAADPNAETLERLKIRSVLHHVADGMQLLMPNVEFDFAGVNPDMRFPLGGFSEWSAVLQNVLANAWNAMLDSRVSKIGFRAGHERSGREWLRISDTGVGLGVSPTKADELFEPFQRRLKISDERRSIAIGGQGLGLFIVRMIAMRRSASVEFVTPEPGYATTLELSWKAAKR